MEKNFPDAQFRGGFLGRFPIRRGVARRISWAVAFPVEFPGKLGAEADFP